MRAIYVNSGHWPPAGMRAAGDPLPARQCQAGRHAAHSRKLSRVIIDEDKKMETGDADFSPSALRARADRYFDFLRGMLALDAE
jgi:hypothetical protein